MPYLGRMVQYVCNGHVTLSSGENVPVVNSFVYQLDGGTGFPSDADMLLTIPSFRIGRWNVVISKLSADYIGDNITIVLVNASGRSPIISSPAPNGAIAGPRLPLKQCVFVRQNSGLRSRNFNGNKRFAPIVEAHVTNDELNAAGQLAWNTVAAQLRTGWKITLSGVTYFFTPVIWSRLLTLTDTHTPPGIGAFIGSCHADKTLGVWRHRSKREELKVFHGARYHFTGPQSVPVGVATALGNIGSAIYDTDGFGTSGQFIIPPGFDGYYRATWWVSVTGPLITRWMSSRVVGSTQVNVVADNVPSTVEPWTAEVSIVDFFTATQGPIFQVEFLNGLGDCTIGDGHCELEFLGT